MEIISVLISMRVIGEGMGEGFVLLVVLALVVSDVSALHYAGQSSLSRRSSYVNTDLVSVLRSSLS